MEYELKSVDCDIRIRKIDIWSISTLHFFLIDLPFMCSRGKQSSSRCSFLHRLPRLLYIYSSVEDSHL